MSRIKHATLGLTFVTCLNFVASYAREIIIAMQFGTGTTTDAFVAAYGFVTTVGEITFGAMLAASIVPAFMSLSERNGDQWQRVVGALTALLLLATCALALVLHTTFPTILTWIAPGFDDATRNLALTFGRVLVWFLPLQALLVLYMLTLNTRHYYVLPAAAYLVVNVVFSLVLLLLVNTAHEAALSAAVLIGYGAAVTLLAIRLLRLGVFRAFGCSAVLLKQMWLPARHMLFSAGLGSSIGLLLASHLIIRLYASFEASGSVAALGFAFRIYEVPLTLIANTAAILALTHFSAMFAAGNTERMMHIIRHMLTWGVIILVPIMVVAYLWAPAIVRLLLERGNFDHHSTLLTASVLQGFAPAIIFEAIFVVFFRLFYAMKQTHVPLQAGCFTVAILILLLEIVHPAELQAIAFCLSLAFTGTALFVLYHIVRFFGASVLPALLDFAKPAFVALLLAGVWLHVLPPTNNLLTLASISAYVLSYAAILWFLMPRARAQLLNMVTP